MMNSMSEIMVSSSPSMPWTPVDYSTYPDGVPMVNFCGGLPYSIMLRPRSIESFMCGLWFVDALIERGIKVYDLVIPLIPGSRQDRINSTGDYLFTLKSVAREINARNFRSVITWDPHSDVCYLIDRLNVIHIDELMVRSGKFAVSEWDAVVAPDAGAAKRAGRVAKLFGLPLIQAWKTRDVTTGKLSGFGVEPIDSKIETVLVVDDICDGGGTFIGLADALLKHNVEPYLWVTHGLFTQGTEVLNKYYMRIYTTDSTLSQKEDVKVLELI